MGRGSGCSGVPNVADRIAQTAAAMLLEEKLEPIFHPDSYGYRPGRSAHDALAVTRRRCWKQDWVLDLDVRAFFDSVPHDLLLKAVAHHTDERWVLLYIKRWLTAPMQMPDGTLIARDKGTPQGSPISPLLANVFMHYAFDTWMVREFPGCPFERYADDIVAHCDSEDQARALRDSIATRLGALGLELHPEKTKVVFCQDANRPGEAEHTSFDFLGYTFRGRLAKGRRGYFVSFAPAISVTARKAVGQKVRAWHLNRRSGTDLSGLAEEIDPQVRGWIGYYGAFYRSELYFPRKAHRRASRSMGHAEIQTTARESCQGSGLAGRGSTAPAPALRPLAPSPAHRRSACGSRMTGDCHVRFCESRGVRFPPATHQSAHRAKLAGQPPARPHALHPNLFQLDQPGRALVRRTDPTTHRTRRPPQRAGPRT